MQTYRSMIGKYLLRSREQYERSRAQHEGDLPFRTESARNRAPASFPSWIGGIDEFAPLPLGNRQRKSDRLFSEVEGCCGLGGAFPPADVQNPPGPVRQPPCPPCSAGRGRGDPSGTSG